MSQESGKTDHDFISDTEPIFEKEEKEEEEEEDELIRELERIEAENKIKYDDLNYTESKEFEDRSLRRTPTNSIDIDSDINSVFRISLFIKGHGVEIIDSDLPRQITNKMRIFSFAGRPGVCNITNTNKSDAYMKDIEQLLSEYHITNDTSSSTYEIIKNYLQSKRKDIFKASQNKKMLMDFNERIYKTQQDKNNTLIKLSNYRSAVNDFQNIRTYQPLVFKKFGFKEIATTKSKGDGIFIVGIDNNDYRTTSNRISREIKLHPEINLMNVHDLLTILNSIDAILSIYSHKKIYTKLQTIKDSIYNSVKRNHIIPPHIFDQNDTRDISEQIQNDLPRETILQSCSISFLYHILFFFGFDVINIIDTSCRNMIRTTGESIDMLEEDVEQLQSKELDDTIVDIHIGGKPGKKYTNNLHIRNKKKTNKKKTLNKKSKKVKKNKKKSKKRSRKVKK